MRPVLGKATSDPLHQEGLAEILGTLILDFLMALLMAVAQHMVKGPRELYRRALDKIGKVHSARKLFTDPMGRNCS